MSWLTATPGIAFQAYLLWPKSQVLHYHTYSHLVVMGLPGKQTKEDFHRNPERDVHFIITILKYHVVLLLSYSSIYLPHKVD